MTISPQAEAFYAAMAAAPQQVSLPVSQRRAAGEHAEDATAEPIGVITEPWRDGLRVRPEAGEPTATVLYLFGGGYMLGSPQSRRKTAGHLALAANADVYLPDYRLAPEHPFPAALDDVTAAYRALPADLPIFVAGDSSGGGLAIVLATALHAQGAVAFSPWADLTCSGRSMIDNAAVDIECTHDSLAQMAGWYAGDTALDDPRLSPALNPAGIPPIIAFVGSVEVLLDDARRVTQGAAATLVVAEGMQHTWPIWVGAFPEADSAMRQAGAWLRDRTGGTGGAAS